MLACTGYAAQSADSKLAPHSFERRDPGPTDVQIDIRYCGVCHSDIHTARSEWGPAHYPVIPGHEIVGTVAAVGKDVSGFAVGDVVGVGCMVDSCQSCEACAKGLEQYCENGFTGTYDAPDKNLPGKFTFGGYSKAIVVDQKFVLRVPKNLELAAVAPLLCAGITTYSPLRHWNVGPGKTVGIVGLGGLGHMALKLAHAMGADVTLFTTSVGKADDARRLGANHVVISKDEEQMKSQARRFDFILDCVSAPHDINAYLALLKLDGTLVQVGVPAEPLPVKVFSLLFPRRHFSGSLIGGIAETQEMLDFCGKHGIVSDIEMIDIRQINEAYDRVVSADVKYRFVIDMDTLQAAA
ncbi:NAD(P)-dependent alcohol dehydrogenase [Acetobacteraceae bacterium KSS8]|uniref:NAD(P)-dependent alcohol dehydrogenase n=1 Tax=Endosaccharibacter trunci TaxID=2812733 RepID=A0ABT1W7M5_9PROT|nr:NAD(P)-dependent alcohol dehydrogenase [Acetobacteraceae bacterium KSS8]